MHGFTALIISPPADGSSSVADGSSLAADGSSLAADGSSLAADGSLFLSLMALAQWPSQANSAVLLTRIRIDNVGVEIVALCAVSLIMRDLLTD